jgi:hypothetical protein
MIYYYLGFSFWINLVVISILGILMSKNSILGLLMSETSLVN